MDNNRLISLNGGNYYITENSSDAYKVVEGNLLIYIAPMGKDGLGRRVFFYEAKAGEVIPAFAYQDLEYCQWRFCFSALEKCNLEVIPDGTTKVLKSKFASKTAIRNYAVEGYEGGLVDQYRINIVIEDGFIRRSQKDRVETSEKVLNLIADSFKSRAVSIEADKVGSRLYDTVNMLCAKYRIPIASFEKITDACKDGYGLADIARLSNFSYREILLTDGWEKRDQGAFVVFDQNGQPFLCLPKRDKSYILYDVENDVSTPVSKSIAHSIIPKAFMVYRPLPTKKLNWKDLFTFCNNSIRPRDCVGLIILTILTAVIGLITPIISQKLYDEYIPLGANLVLFQLGCLLASFMVANILFSIVKSLVTFKITSRMAYDFQAAIYNRVFNLPESFFRRFESADLAQRIMGAGTIVNTIATVVITSLVAVVYAVIFFAKMLGYSVELTLVGLLMLVIYGAIIYFISIKAMKYRRRTTELEGMVDSKMYQFLNGIAKIRIAGVEDRALYEYMKPYVKLRENESKHDNINGFSNALALIINSVFSVCFYILIIKTNQSLSIGSFIAFTSLFGSFAGYIMKLIDCLCKYKEQSPLIERMKPVLSEVPEYDEGKELPGDISGAIEINNVSFAYDDNNMVLQDINLNIKAGEYVGIVGPSGCGKSTLLKLLLGFERTSSGKIYFDNKDIESIDKRELRKRMGVVLQDGKLISGSIFENITITAPMATLNDVRNVVAAVGLADDINEMPMGLNTVLSEDCGTISGGQQQRILIARALISGPSILLFDEATSALDNVTQSMVCETLENIEATRIVIAHRLSTIMNCDRIIVLNGGKVVEQGTYEELMANKNLFYQLASRQMA